MGIYVEKKSTEGLRAGQTPHVARAMCVFALIKFPGKPYMKFNGTVTGRAGARSRETFHV